MTSTDADEVAMSVASLFSRPSGLLPVSMSSVAMALIVVQVVTVGVAPQPDEGAAAHVWQLLMVAQLPVIAYFAIRWLPLAPREGLIVLLTQVVFALGAAAPVFLLGF